MSTRLAADQPEQGRSCVADRRRLQIRPQLAPGRVELADLLAWQAPGLPSTLQLTQGCGDVHHADEHGGARGRWPVATFSEKKLAPELAPDCQALQGIRGELTHIGRR